MPTPKHIRLPDALAGFLDRRPGAILTTIRSEASRRRFFRIRFGGKSLVAMVYPEPALAEVERFCAVQKIYLDRGLRVPHIEDVLDDQVVIQEDLGDLLLQRAWRLAGHKGRRFLLGRCRELLAGLAGVPAGLATARLDPARREWEMDFFLSHFFPRFSVRSLGEEALRVDLRRLVGMIAPESTFAHRDFHSRNLLVLKNEIVMVDFQDALVAPRYYDLVSLAFDSYLELGRAREILFSGREWPAAEHRQLRLTALQRNIKALGTFAYQTHECHHPVYARYIPRTLRHIRGHLEALADPQFAVLTKYFDSVTSNA